MMVRIVSRQSWHTPHACNNPAVALCWDKFHTMEVQLVSGLAVLKLVIQILLVILSFLLTLLILMHKGKGGGLSDMFGGGLTQNAGSSGVAEKNLNRWTVIIALLWVALIITLDRFMKFNIGG